MIDIKKQKRATMEIKKVSMALLGTVIIAFGTFMLQTGTYRNELKNIKEQQLIIKADLKQEIQNKADKVVVNMIFEEIKSIKEILNTKEK